MNLRFTRSALADLAAIHVQLRGDNPPPKPDVSLFGQKRLVSPPRPTTPKPARARRHARQKANRRLHPAHAQGVTPRQTVLTSAHASTARHNRG